MVTSVTAAVMAPSTSWVAIGLATTYVAAAVIAAAMVSQGDRRTLPVLPLVFAMLHVSYGLGFFRGLVAFRARWRTPGAEGAGTLPRRPISA